MSSQPTYDASDAQRAAFDELYRAFHPRLLRFCRFKTGDAAVAEDIAQEALLRALDHRHHLDPLRPAWPWLKAVANNLVVDHARRREREARLLAAASADAALEQGGEDALRAVEDGPLVRDALRRLPLRQRTALYLRYVHEWTPQEAAGALGVSVPAFTQLLYRARGALSGEYRRLADSDRRPAAWLPVLLLARLRGRLNKAAAWLGHAVSPAAVAGEAAATLAVVVAVSGILGMTLPQPFRLPPAAEATPAVTRGAQAPAAAPRRSQPRAAETTGAAGSPTASDAVDAMVGRLRKAPADVSAPDVELRVPSPKPKAEHDIERDDEGMTISNDVTVTIDEVAPNTPTGTTGETWIACDGMVSGAVCDVADEAEEEDPNKAHAAQ